MSRLRAAWLSGKTRPLEYRVAQLEALGRFLEEKKQDILEALALDMHKVRPPGLGTRSWGSRGALPWAWSRWVWMEAALRRPRPSPAAPTPTKFSPRGLHNPASSEIDPGWMGAWGAPGDVPPSPPAAASACRVSEGWGRADPQRAPGPLTDTSLLWCCSFPCAVGTSQGSLSSVLRPC